MAKGLNADTNALLNKLGQINKKLCCLTGTSASCGCDCNGLDVNLDLSEVLAALEVICEKLENLEVNLELNVMCDKEYLCDPDCNTVRCKTCYSVDTGETLSEIHTLLDGTTYTGDLLLLDPDCSKCDDKSCNPWHGGGSANSLPAEELTDSTFIFPDCGCSGTIETSIGTIPFYTNMTELCIPNTGCNYTIDSINIAAGSTCTVDDIYWFASRKS